MLKWLLVTILAGTFAWGLGNAAQGMLTLLYLHPTRNWAACLAMIFFGAAVPALLTSIFTGDAWRKDWPAVITAAIIGAIVTTVALLN